MTELKAGSGSRLIQYDMLIDQGQYASLADHLFDIQSAIEGTNQPDLINLVAAALQICMFCQQCQNEMAWHEKANQEIRHRLRDLEGQLHALLNSIVDYESGKDVQLTNVSVNVTLLHDRIPPGVKERPTLWQRIRDLLNFEPVPPNPERQMTKVVVNTSFPSAVEVDGRVTHLDRRSEELLPPTSTEAETTARTIAEGTDVYTPTIKEVESVEQFMAPVNSIAGRELQDASAAHIEETSQTQGVLPSLVVYCLGPLRVYINGQPTKKWPGLKGKSIFKYLVCHREHPIQRDILMDLFWPDGMPEASRRNLYQAIYNLRQALRNGGPDFAYILQEESSYYLNPELDLWVDSEAFVKHYHTGQEMERERRMREAMEAYELAEQMYEGEYLSEDRYEDWTIIFRENLKHSYLDILDRLSRFYFDEGEMALCITYCQKILIEDNCREDAHRRLMRCYQRQGQRHLAVRQYHVCVEALQQELEVPPMPATINLFKRIQARASGDKTPLKSRRL